MDIHILTPFYRKHLLPTLIKYLKPMNIIWHPVCDPVDIQAFENNSFSWIKGFLTKPITDSAYRKINDFIEAGHIIDSDYYCCMGDDDMFEPGLFDMVRQQTAKIIFISGSLGDSVPDSVQGGHQPRTLWIKKSSDIITGSIGFAQFIVKGEILKQIKFRLENCYDDGALCMELRDRWPNDYVIMSNWFVFGNYFEKGRYTNNNWKIKPEWENPVFYELK